MPLKRIPREYECIAKVAVEEFRAEQFINENMFYLSHKSEYVVMRFAIIYILCKELQFSYWSAARIMNKKSHQPIIKAKEAFENGLYLGYEQYKKTYNNIKPFFQQLERDLCQNQM